MKGLLHAIAGVFGFLCVAAFLSATVLSGLLGSPETIALVKTWIFRGVFLLLPALAGAGATGMSMLGERQEPLALIKQQRGPRAFMTTLFVLLPCGWLLSTWAAAGQLGLAYAGVQAVELATQAFCLVMIGLNIRDGLALRGRIARGRRETPIIEARDGGPLVVHQAPRLTGSDGAAHEARPVLALCRCGASKNKPFCDGSHNEIGFDSRPSADRTKDEILTYEGKDVNVHYNRLLCSHAAECGRRQKAAFDSSRKPWIVPDNATVGGIREVVAACPSGALRFSLAGEMPQHARRDEPGITVETDGPYRVTGLPLASAPLATGANPEKYVLCRCGASKNKPFCDGSHYDIGWSASGEAR